MNYFEELYNVPVEGHVEKKNGLDYLNWAYAWQQLKLKHPEATFTIYENADGWNYHTDGRTAWVKTGVTIYDEEFLDCIEHIEYLPVMDFRNKSIPADMVTSFDVNKAIQRSLTKAIARHGLGISLYIGWKDESIPEEPEKISPQELETVTALITKAGVEFETILQTYRIRSLSEMTTGQYANACSRLSKTIEQNK